ncbi:GNAT family N-acetyltransferase [Bacillus carboniphilus]|uniref:GNAT family N-acetyltransferase n=1 Tax=Bacillus carboniphilus TaxID=86663 RepID=A0ABY9JUT2_9BACI|nr:GNAT family N-acetyltransferase [Bacillus carboniphilus]WLR42063.1 GNAT family N-acetyltransferase [Bacillus carboniphilus]
MNIRKLELDEKPPIDLLLLADPSHMIVERYIERGDCYIAEKEGEAIGVYVLLPTKPNTIELVNVAVKETYQKQGFGKQLVLDALKQAALCGFKTVEVGTGNSSIEQLALYQKCGFRIKSVDSDFFVKHYPQVIYENGIQCRDMVRLSIEL